MKSPGPTLVRDKNGLERPNRLPPDDAFEVDGWEVTVFALAARTGGWSGYVHIKPPNATARKERTVINRVYGSRSEFLNAAVQVAVDRVNQLKLKS